MKIIIAVLKSKAQVMQLIDIARSYGIVVKAIPIPKEIKIGCGICVQFNFFDTQKILRIIKSNNLNAFYGIFQIEKNGFKNTFKRIY